MKALLKNTQSGVLKHAPLGFSWTTLFFGGFTALFRGDLKWAVIMWIVGGVAFSLAVVTSGFLFFLPLVSSLVFAATYNKMYVQDLIAQGFAPADNRDKHALAREGTGIATPSPAERDEASEPGAKSLELTVLSVAKEKGGIISAVDVAMEAESEIDKAKEQLDAMVDKGHAEFHLTKTGNTVYVIPSMLTEERRDELEPML